MTYVVGVSAVGMSWIGQAQLPCNVGSRAPDESPKPEICRAHRLRWSFNPAPRVVIGFGDITAIEAFRFLEAIATGVRAEPRAATRVPRLQGTVIRSRIAELSAPEA